MLDRSSDGAYARSNIFDGRGTTTTAAPTLIPELRDVVAQFHDYVGLAAHLAKIALEMEEYELDPRSPEGQQTVARVLHARLTKPRNWTDGTVEADLERTALDRGSMGTNVVYYVDLYSAATPSCMKCSTRSSTLPGSSTLSTLTATRSSSVDSRHGS